MSASSNAEPIERRDLHFDLEDCDMNRWHGAGPHVTQFYNALSILFPEGEKFFIDSVRNYRERIRSPELAEQVRGFIGQEAMHSREHIAYNKALRDAGLPVEKLESGVRQRLRLGRKIFSPKSQLAITIALEHFTAIMADSLLSDPRTLEGSDPKMTALWRWHAIEETEHKSVAFDVYQEQVGTGAGAYLRRVLLMLHVSIHFWFEVIRNHLSLARGAGVAGSLKGWLQVPRYLFVSPGPLRRILGQYLAYYRPGFHPWERDNRVFVEQWKSHYASTGQPPA